MASQKHGSLEGYVGKGAVAASLRLTHFIDDRVECLHSVFFEGWLATAEAGGLEAAPCQGALMSFGSKAKKLPTCAAKDGSLNSLLASPAARPKAKPKAKRGKPSLTPEERWDRLTDAQRSAWPQVSALLAARPAGKPKDSADLESRRRHSAEEKALKKELGDGR